MNAAGAVSHGSRTLRWTRGPSTLVVNTTAATPSARARRTRMCRASSLSVRREHGRGAGAILLLPVRRTTHPTAGEVPIAYWGPSNRLSHPPSVAESPVPLSPGWERGASVS